MYLYIFVYISKQKPNQQQQTKQTKPKYNQQQQQQTLIFTGPEIWDSYLVREGATPRYCDLLKIFPNGDLTMIHSQW